MIVVGAGLAYYQESSVVSFGRGRADISRIHTRPFARAAYFTLATGSTAIPWPSVSAIIATCS